jgi:hypothetical protein
MLMGQLGPERHGNESKPVVFSPGKDFERASNVAAPPDSRQDLDRPPSDLRLSEELAVALQKVVVARARLKAEPPRSPGYQVALTGYLQAAVHHLAIFAVAQAQQCEQLSAEVADLRARLDALHPTVH